ncbi:hypothetical protein AMS62_19675 [Bacillus sp. FJAT-18019]|nr:hypothetical protein AMS62_19675 [Bacillus sp. FJAT-18019]
MIILEIQERFFKLPRILIIVLVLLSVLGLSLYFTYPLKIQNVLQQTENIEGIHVTYISNSKFTNYLLSKDQGIHFNELIQLMDEITYTRKLNTFQGGSGDVIFMTVFYRGDDGESNNYFVDIRELGIIICHKKEYKMDGDSTELINKLVNWIMSNGSKLEDGTDSI